MESSAGGFPGLPPVANPEQRGLMLPSPIDVPRAQLSLTCVPGQTGTVSRCRFCRCVKPSRSRLKWAGTRRVWGQQLRPGRVPLAGGRRGPFPPATLEQGTEAFRLLVGQEPPSAVLLGPLEVVPVRECEVTLKIQTDKQVCLIVCLFAISFFAHLGFS